MTPRLGGHRPGAGRKAKPGARTKSLPSIRVSIDEWAAAYAALEPGEPMADFQREAVAALVAKRNCTEREAARSER